MSDTNMYPKTKPLYKKWWFWGIIILIYYFTLSDDNKKPETASNSSPATTQSMSSPLATQSNTNPTPEPVSPSSTPDVSYEEYANLPITNPLYLRYFESKYGIKLDIFPEGSEIGKFFNNFDEMMKNRQFLKIELYRTQLSRHGNRVLR